MTTTAEELEHVLRPLPPWRRAELTECGRDDARNVITRDQFIAKVKREGKQRSAMTTCMTCWHTAQRHGDWAQSPADVIARDVSVYARKKIINPELRAIAALIEAHPEEFYGYLEGLEEAPSLAEARRRRYRGRR